MATRALINRKIFQDYIRYLHFKKKPIPCPLCQNLALPKDYESHCTERHRMNSKLCCVWCFGAVSWPSRAKTQHAEHLFHCSRKFLVLSPKSPPVLDAFNATPFCQEKDRFGRAFDPQPKAYDPVWPLPLPPARMTYDIESLNLASACVRSYLERDAATYWCHAIVRGVAFRSFLEAVDVDEGRTRTLPFFCWCDGGQLREARFRVHRHMILVSPSRDHFQNNVWKKIQVSRENKPSTRFRALHTEPIRSALHLVNTLGYVSRRESICEFSGDTKNSPETLNHYYVHHSLPQDYRLALVLEWPNGLYDLLNQDFKNMAYDTLVRCEMKFVDAKWRIPIRSIPGIGWGKKIPFAPNWHPYDHSKPHYIHLLKGKIFYFEFQDHPTDFNFCLYDAVQNEEWPPRPFHQRLIRNFKPLVDRNTELELEINQLREQMTDIRNENTQILRAENDRLRAELAQLRVDLAQLQAATNQPES